MQLAPKYELLLKAGLLETSQALEAWNAFLENADLEDSDPLKHSFLPLVYQNLKGTNALHLNRCKSVLRHIWVTNQLLLKMASHAKELLNQAGIPSIYLKGAALIQGYYQNPGLRQLGDIDLLVPREMAAKAISLLLSNGWKSETDRIVDGDIQRYIRRSHALILTYEEGQKLDLHWSVFTNSGLDTLLRNYPYQGRAEDLLLHTLIHGLTYSPTPLIRWIPDSVMILRNAPNFDWDFFLKQAEQLKVTFFIYKGLKMLQNLGVYQPPQVIFDAMPKPTDIEIAYYHFMNCNQPRLPQMIKRYWYAHLRNSPTPQVIRCLLSFPKFIKEAQHLNHTYELLPFLVKTLADMARKSPKRVISAPTQFTEG